MFGIQLELVKGRKTMKHVVTLNAGAIYIKNSGVVFQIVHDDYSIKETFGK